MFRQSCLEMFLCSMLVIPIGVTAAECDDPKTSEQIAQCVGSELRDSDAKINSAYQELMGRLSETDRTALRSAQRAWIKERDSTCKLDAKESNREKWYQALLQDYVKTVCVTRYTRKRTTELESALAKLSVAPTSEATPVKPVPSARPAPAPGTVLTYDRKPATVHATGKWYFEIAVNFAEIVKIEPCVLTVGASDQQHQQFTGVLNNIRVKDAGKDILRYGIAIDLDNGKLYYSENGAWVRGEPGSNLGMDLKLGRNYYALFATSAESNFPYLLHNAIAPNFGDTAMAYAIPAGYTPWRNRTPN